MRGFLLQLLFQRLQEYVENVEVKAVGLSNYGAEFVLNQGRKNDGSSVGICRRLIDSRSGIHCLVFGTYKWQSHLPKILRVKLCQQAMT
jgi:TolB-like protein